MTRLVLLAPLLAWSCGQDGAQGDRGPAGPAGPMGPAGPTFEPVTYTVPVPEAPPAVAYCDEGDVFTGGLCSTGAPEIIEEDGAPVGVSCSAAAIEITATAICMESDGG